MRCQVYILVTVSVTTSQKVFQLRGSTSPWANSILGVKGISLGTWFLLNPSKGSLSLGKVPPLETLHFPPAPPLSLSLLVSLPQPMVLLLRGKAALNGLGAASPCIFNGHARHAGISAWIMHRGWVRERSEEGHRVVRESGRDYKSERKMRIKRRRDERSLRTKNMLGEWAQRKKDRDVYFGIITALTE